MVYLDSAATTPPKFFAKDYAQYWANPNSSHALGLEANQALTEAKNRIKKALSVSSGVVLFCRCATEAVEWLCNKIVKLYDKNFQICDRRYFVICSKYEHDSVFDCCGDIFSTTNRLKDWMGLNEIYFHQYVNQLTGTVFPIESIGKQVQSTGAFFGSDITAAIGHYPLLENLDSFCDAVWFSGHKFGCEPGIGAIWLSDRLFKYLGGSEDSRNNYNLIHGTPNVSAAVAMSYAMEHAIDGLEDGNDEHWRSLLGYLEIKLLGNRIECDVIAKDQPKTYAINALYLPGFNADALTNFLSSHDIYISPGHSACTSNVADATRVLEAFGLTKEQASQTVRVSFGEDTTQEDIDALVKGIVEFKEMFV